MKRIFFIATTIIHILSCIAISAQENHLSQAKGFLNRTQNNLSFEENKGQITGPDANRVKFTVKDQNLKVFLLNDGIAYQFEKINYPEGYDPKAISDPASTPQEQKHQQELMEKVSVETYRMDMQLFGANQHARITTEQKSTDYINYYNHDALNVHSYQKVRYKNIYPNIDWVLYVRDGKMEYEFEVHPGGDPNKIQMQLKWVKKSSIDTSGNLHLENSMGKITDKAPETFQSGKKIESAYILNDKKLSFNIQQYDPNQTLVIDPTLDWATYYGGTSFDYGYSCATDALGNAYLNGSTQSPSIIASGGYQNIYGGGSNDAFLVKFNASGIRQWATYYGGASNDAGRSCTIDFSGNIYLTGTTASLSGITSGGYQNVYGGGTSDAFIIKFDAAGIRQWATYYGGSDYDYGGSCITDALGNVYLAGSTASTSGIASGGYQNVYGGGSFGDAFLVKFNAAGIRQWATYYGGSNNEDGFSCATDASGNVYMSGRTFSTNGIASGGYQNTFGGNSDPFLVKFNSFGVRQWATYYGGSGYEEGWSCTTDNIGNIYLAGMTYSSNNIASGGFQNIIGGSSDAFLVKFSTTGIRQWATYYGGAGADAAEACTTDAFGNVYMTGWTTSTTGITSGGYQNVYGGGYDAFLAKFNASGIRQWATYYGGSSYEEGWHCATDASGNLYLSGFTGSTNDIAFGGHQNIFGGGTYDAFLVKFNECISYSFTINQSICEGASFLGHTTSGTYIDTFTSVQGCDSIRNINLTVKPKSYLSITDSICQGGNLYGYTTTGTHIDTFTAANGCDSIRTIHLTVKPQSHNELDTILCYNVIFNWNGNTITSSGDYYFTGTNSLNCDSIVHISVAYTPVPTSIDSVITGCDAVMYSGEVYTNNTEFIDTFKNSNGCDSLYRNVTINVSKTTHDTLHINLCQGESYDFNGRNFTTTALTTDTFTNSNGCDSLITLDLKVHPLPNVTLEYEPHLRDVLCEGDTISLIGAGAKEYIYYNNLGDTLRDRQRPVVKIITDENHYFVKGTDEYGCSGQSGVTIYAEACCNIMIPNAFSPNGDGLNDGFGVETLGHPYNFVLQVFDRWGKRVFISHNPKEKWDGKYNGGNMGMGTYYYIVTANCSNTTSYKQKGDVNLIR
ncbi:T9SS type B sorting domain-containing protein [Taibaiella lutea]|uniref:T9SS type B sorting domain-containing protein n=1 Tax=Taibaiella lutea TaxID=2608001 RepID=A0A5M6CIQ3_9BACT|nr:SBBP repeat-containing protein [Taibaiella lutea]KAA5534897.1 T9SS type B sorting domain-containing protein [Taibaiella lutea]